MEVVTGGGCVDTCRICDDTGAAPYCITVMAVNFTGKMGKYLSYPYHTILFEGLDGYGTCTFTAVIWYEYRLLVKGIKAFNICKHSLNT